METTGGDLRPAADLVLCASSWPASSAATPCRKARTRAKVRFALWPSSDVRQYRICLLKTNAREVVAHHHQIGSQGKGSGIGLRRRPPLQNDQVLLGLTDTALQGQTRPRLVCPTIAFASHLEYAPPFCALGDTFALYFVQSRISQHSVPPSQPRQ